MATARHKGFVFTWNNPDSTKTADALVEEIWVKLSENNCDYLIGGLETAPTTGTLHLQGYCHFPHARTFNSIKKLLPSGCHIESANGTASDSKAYCSKDGNFAERGNCPEQGKRNDLATIKKAVIEEHKDVGEILDLIGNHQQLKFAENLQRYRVLQPRQSLKVIWCHGETGTGKTTWAYNTYGYDLYTHTGTRWFDGYTGQKVALFDDYRPDWFPWSLLLKLLDRFPLRVEIKGGFTMWKPEVIVITTPFDPVTTFLGIQPENLGQISRRITETKAFPLPPVVILSDEEPLLSRVEKRPRSNDLPGDITLTQHGSDGTEVGGNTTPLLPRTLFSDEILESQPAPEDFLTGVEQAWPWSNVPEGDEEY